MQLIKRVRLAFLSLNKIVYTEHPACNIFARYESNHCIIESIPQLALFLYKEKMIGEMIVSVTGGAQIMMEVKEAICANHSNLEKFAVILKKSDITMCRSIAGDIKEEFSKSIMACMCIYKLLYRKRISWC